MNLSNELKLGLALVLIALTAILSLWMLHRATDPKTCKNKVKGMLKRFAALRQYKVLSDVTVQYEGKKAHFDQILVGVYGISFVSCLADSAAYYGQEREEKWAKVDSKTGKKSYFANPITAGEKAIDLVRRVFSKNNVYGIQMEHLIVFAGSPRKTEIFVKGSIPMLRRSDLKKLLDKVRYEEDRGVDVEKIVKLLQDHAE